MATINKQVKLSIIGDANSFISEVTKIQKSLNTLHISGKFDAKVLDTFDKLSEKMKNLQELSSKDITSTNQINKLKEELSDVTRLMSRLKQLGVEVQDLDVNSLSPKNATKSFKEINHQIENFEKELKNSTSAANVLRKKIDEIKTAQSKVSSTKKEGSQLEKQLKEQTAAYEKAEKARRNFYEANKDTSGGGIITQKKEGAGFGSIKGYKDENTKNQYKTLVEEANRAKEAINKTNSEIGKNSSNLQKAEKELQQMQGSNNTARKAINELNKQINTIETAELDKLRDSLSKILKIDIGKVPNDLNEIKTYINQLSDDRLEEINKELEKMKTAASNTEEPVRQMGRAINAAGEEVESIAKAEKEINSLKTSLEAFFSIQQGINLLKRTVREAYESVKELDKAMTDTAVVTDFSVGDMWEALPKYTEAANELGTTTLGAYETMTLYYQQGLKTNEVFEIGTETMKMARIAGMDYVKATDLRNHWVA